MMGQPQSIELQAMMMQQQSMMQAQMLQPQMMMDGNMMGVPQIPQVPITDIQQANITLVGNKTKPGDMCCFMITIMFASCLIFPLCFMCCTWWKKIVYPMYELTAQAYNSLGNFLLRHPTINNLNLTVVDNGFNA